MKINKQNLTGKRASMSYAQIIILIVSSFAFGYIIYSATEIVNAQGVEDYACCEKTKQGNTCQFVEEEKCDTNSRAAPTRCENTDYCKLGCCYSFGSGWCNEKTPKRSCEELGGQWEEDEFCNIPKCQRGCCVLGRNAIWTTEKNCEVKAEFYGLPADFRQDINLEDECLFLSEKDDEGACVTGDIEKTCRFTTRENCRTSRGGFYKNIFCSDSGLETGCLAEERAGCLEGEDSVFWFDSCGNQEGIKEECSIFTSTICGQEGGDYKCKSLDCQTKEGARKNGESWCEYEGTIGEGRDVVGSRHERHICFMGEERVEPCEDYRNQICVQTDSDLGNGEVFSEAACRINNWRQCLDYNTQENKEKTAEKCQENPDCFIKNVNAADNFDFDFCASKYPPGFDLRNEASGKNAEMVCSMASQTCTVIYVKRVSGWKCKVNCGCEESGFTEQMNELCTSLGDCGGYVNVVGEATDDGYSVSGAPRIDASRYREYANDKQGQKAEPGSLDFFGSLGEISYEGDYRYKNVMGVGGIGFALQVASLAILPKIGIKAAISSALAHGGTAAGGGGGIASVSATLGSFGNVLVAAGAAMAAASILSMAFDIDYGTALAITIVSVVTYIAIMKGAGAITFKAIFAAFQWLLIPFLIILIALKLLGIGKTKKKIVTFNCLPWQAPTGGEDCSRCNPEELLDIPCSDYRCQSLGQTCELINKGTEQELCVDNSPNDVISPGILPLYGVITEGYEYFNIQANGFEVAEQGGNCIPEFTNIIYGIETDKPSQCKIGSSALQTYDEMPDYFGGSNLYLTEHANLFNLPSPSAFANQYNLTYAQIRALEEINFYVKCKSVNGIINQASYTIRMCVKPGPDLTAPRITKTSPANNAFIAYNATEQILQVWTNEPADCKYSEKDKDYESMENSMSCQRDLEDYSLWGWSCNATLTDLGSDSQFYIKCQDISDNKNAMTESDVYSLSKSEFELLIDNIEPADGEEILSGVESATVNLEVKTSGGAEQGKAECSFRFRENGDYIKFLDTSSSSHNQVFSSITGGNYKIYVKCEDIAGNIAEDFTGFNVKIDTTPPIITRAYYDRSLKVATNENAVCAYSFTDSKCRFYIENTTLMSGTSKEHSAEWQTDATYYIKCEDDYENEPGRCSIIVRPYDI